MKYSLSLWCLQNSIIQLLTAFTRTSDPKCFTWSLCKSVSPPVLMIKWLYCSINSLLDLSITYVQVRQGSDETKSPFNVFFLFFFRWQANSYPCHSYITDMNLIFHSWSFVVFTLYCANVNILSIVIPLIQNTSCSSHANFTLDPVISSMKPRACNFIIQILLKNVETSSHCICFSGFVPRMGVLRL